MKKSNNYVGIDISKLTFDVAISSSDGKYKYFKFANNHEGFMMFLERLNDSESICVMEASGPYYLELATFLSEQSKDVCVINPLIIRRFSQMRMSRAKTDKKDAMLIAEYGKTEKPDLWQPEAAYILELKQMQAYLEQLNKNNHHIIWDKHLLDPNIKNQMDFLELNSSIIIPSTLKTNAAIIQWIVESKWKLEEFDKDAVVMMHEIDFLLNGEAQKITSSLVLNGKDNVHTAMATTVGLPLAMATVAYLDGELNLTGLHLPTIPAIYQPILKKLAEEGIEFYEVAVGSHS